MALHIPELDSPLFSAKPHGTYENMELKSENELRNRAICAIMNMDIKDVLRYLEYFKGDKN